MLPLGKLGNGFVILFLKTACQSTLRFLLYYFLKLLVNVLLSQNFKNAIKRLRVSLKVEHSMHEALS
jgi:hypothetical protein